MPRLSPLPADDAEDVLAAARDQALRLPARVALPLQNSLGSAVSCAAFALAVPPENRSGCGQGGQQGGAPFIADSLKLDVTPPPGVRE